ncbi:MAG: hypothetical protein WA431_09805 [Candidatus Cybelea sp.]
MRISGLSHYAFSIGAAVALLVGCGGSPQPPIGASGAMAQAPAIAPHMATSGSPLKPRARSLGYKVTPPLLYAINIQDFNVTVYRASAMF